VDNLSHSQFFILSFILNWKTIFIYDDDDDDLLIKAAGMSTVEIVKRLNEALTRIEKWCSENGIHVNTDKTEFVLFHKIHDSLVQFLMSGLVMLELRDLCLLST